MSLPRLSYNSPVVLTLALAAIAVHLLDQATPGALTRNWFALPSSFNWKDITDWFRLVSYPIGHADWTHLAGNLTLWLILGPMMEEKYGTATLLEMVLITAVVTAVLNMAFFHTGLLGMSGLVFMLIILSSVTNFRAGQVPLTFLLVAGLFLGKEVVEAFQSDRISQFAHILGGVCGSLFGFAGPGRKSA